MFQGAKRGGRRRKTEQKFAILLATGVFGPQFPSTCFS